MCRKQCKRRFPNMLQFGVLKRCEKKGWCEHFHIQLAAKLYNPLHMCLLNKNVQLYGPFQWSKHWIILKMIQYYHSSLTIHLRNKLYVIMSYSQLFNPSYLRGHNYLANKHFPIIICFICHLYPGNNFWQHSRRILVHSSWS